MKAKAFADDQFQEQLKAATPDASVLGYAALTGVAVLWGSYAPALKHIFMTDLPPSAPLLAALQAVLSAIFLIGSESLAGDAAHKEKTEVLLEHHVNVDGHSSAPAHPENQGGLWSLVSSALNWKSKNLAVAGAELGLWMCLAFGLEVLGVQLISATKTAFLNQATVLITPMLVYLAGHRVNRNEWIACVMGLAGSVLVAADGLMHGGGGGHGHAMVTDENPLGYAYVLASALFFAMSTVRLGNYSNEFDSLNLASASTISLAAYSVCWVTASIMGTENGLQETYLVLRSLFSNPDSALVLVWVGLGPGALASFLQATGQKSVPAAQAQVILSLTPIFAALIAMFLLSSDDESMGGVAWGGAALMLGASVVASVQHSSEEKAAADAAAMELVPVMVLEEQLAAEASNHLMVEVSAGSSRGEERGSS